MTARRRRMGEELHRWGLAPKPQPWYVEAVKPLAQDSRRAPGQRSAAESWSCRCLIRRSRWRSVPSGATSTGSRAGTRRRATGPGRSGRTRGPAHATSGPWGCVDAVRGLWGLGEHPPAPAGRDSGGATPLPRPGGQGACRDGSCMSSAATTSRGPRRARCPGRPRRARRSMARSTPAWPLAQPCGHGPAGGGGRLAAGWPCLPGAVRGSPAPEASARARG